ncbi:MAG: BamA/TamA family outer membrane protein [Bacteroidia bacterium]|nr:BamA/TamA family outer membrane protein [Bacteroidia bacterium]
MAPGLHPPPWRWMVMAGLLSGVTSCALYAQPPAVVIVGHIELTGNTRTRDWVILRELPFQVGDTVLAGDWDALLAQGRTLVYNLGLFTEVTADTLSTPPLTTVRLDCPERWYIFGSPLLGLAERNSYDIVQAFRRGDLRRLIYGGTATWRNVTGRNETLYLGLQGGFSSRLDLDYQAPGLIRRWNTDVGGGFHYARERELILGTVSGVPQWRNLFTEPLRTQVAGYFFLRKRFSLYNSLLLEARYQRYQVSDSLYQMEAGGVPFRYLTQRGGVEQWPSWMIGWVHDTRDLRGFPQRGHKLGLYLRAHGPGGRGPVFTRVGINWAQHIPLGRRWNLTWGTQHALTIGQVLPWFEKSLLHAGKPDFPGQSEEIRGYEPYLLAGTRLHLAKTELKWALFSFRMVHLPMIPFKQFQYLPAGAYITAFMDLGYLADKSIIVQDPWLHRQLLAGTGVGLNLIGGYDALLRVEFTRNHLGQTGLYLHTTVPIK